MRDEFMITRQGKQYVLFAGLLDEAHSRGLKGIDTELLQVPEEANGNMAVIKATVEMEDGRIFSGIGDASPENVGRAISPHLIRMAETRAKARALRDAVNVGATALEELSDGDDAPPADNGRRNRPSPVREAPVREMKSRQRQSPPEEDPAPNGSQEDPEDSGSEDSGPGGSRQASRSRKSQSDQGKQRARKSQVDLLKTLLVEVRGEDGVQKMEKHLGKSISELSRREADQWIDKLTPEDRE